LTAKSIINLTKQFLGKQIMCKRFLSTIMLALVIGSASLNATSAQTRTMKELQKIAKIKARAASFSNEPKAKVVVELEDGETIKGSVRSIADDSFVVENFNGSGATEIAYLQVKDIRKKPAKGLIVGEVAAAAGASVGLLYLTAFLLSKCSPCIGP